MSGFEVTLFGCFQSAGSLLSRNARDELSDPRQSRVKVIGLLLTTMPLLKRNSK
jgi:hypothetical protein